MATQEAAGRVDEIAEEFDLDDAETPIDIWRHFPEITGSKFFEEYLTRLVAGRDMRAYVSGNAETGVGKTRLAIVLCILCDIHGWSPEKGTLDKSEYLYMFDKVPPGSWLLLDESEAALDKRRGMESEQVSIGHDFMTKRYQQVFGLMTLPTKNWMDDRFAEDSADYWIQCQSTDKGRPLGEAKIYRLQHNEHYETTYTKWEETIVWPKLEGHPVVRAMDRKKANWVEGDTESRYVHRDEHEEALKNYWEKAVAKTRFGLVKAMYEQTDLTQTEVSEITKAAEGVEGVGQKTVSNYAQADSFESYYNDE